MLCNIFRQDQSRYKYIHIIFYKGGQGVNSTPPPPKAKEMEKMETFPFLHEILHPRRVYSPVMMWI